MPVDYGAGNGAELIFRENQRELISGTSGRNTSLKYHYNTRLTRRAGLRRRLAKNGLTLRGKNGTFSEKKVTKKSPKTGSGWINPLMVTSQFFHEFPGSLKFQDEMPGVGKRGEAGAYDIRKNNSNL